MFTTKDDLRAGINMMAGGCEETSLALLKYFDENSSEIFELLDTYYPIEDFKSEELLSYLWKRVVEELEAV